MKLATIFDRVCVLRSGLRVMAVDSYVLAYEPREDGIEVVAVILGARDWETTFRGGYR